MQQRRAFTKSELITGFKAITNWSREECELLADLFTIFEHDGYVLDNELTTDERREFYYLEEHKILEARRDITKLNGNREWRIFQWTLNYELLNRKLLEIKSSKENVGNETELEMLYSDAFDSHYRERDQYQKT